ncbi:hypothetical protein [Clostridium botulinum]|uniref:hypothetical protein n=1 Tax=Clostridium botulinum TaxID=1491 RepID=UPI003DA3B279
MNKIFKNESKIIVDIKPCEEFSHVFQGILSLEALDKVILTYNTGELVFAEFISVIENEWKFRINNEIVFFNQIKVPIEYKDYTFNVNNIKYALVLRKVMKKEYEKIVIIDYNNEYSKLVEFFNGDEERITAKNS